MNNRIGVLLLIISVCLLAAVNTYAVEEARETIIYDITPMGFSVYEDFGSVEFCGRRTNLVVFKTQVAGFKDTEKIYSDPKTYLPLWVERNLSMWLHKEYLTEEYVAEENKLTITKFEGGKKTNEYFFKGKGPIHNAILLPFSLRKAPDLRIGSSYDIRLPDEFKVKLVSIEDITVPAGAFNTYHFTSAPHKFEIWITTDTLRLPVKIKGLSGFSYTLLMKKHILRPQRR